MSTYVRLTHDDEITPSAGPTPDSLDPVMAGQETNKAVRAKTNEVQHSQTRIQQPSLMLDAALHGEKLNSNPGILYFDQNAVQYSASSRHQFLCRAV